MGLEVFSVRWERAGVKQHASNLSEDDTQRGRRDFTAGTASQAHPPLTTTTTTGLGQNNVPQHTRFPVEALFSSH